MTLGGATVRSIGKDGTREMNRINNELEGGVGEEKKKVKVLMKRKTPLHHSRDEVVRLDNRSPHYGRIDRREDFDQSDGAAANMKPKSQKEEIGSGSERGRMKIVFLFH